MKSSKSDPVLLKVTPTDDALAKANPSPRFRSATPLAWNANFWSPRTIIAIRAFRTPTLSATPASTRASASLATITRTSPSAEAPENF